MLVIDLHNEQCPWCKKPVEEEYDPDDHEQLISGNTSGMTERGEDMWWNWHGYCFDACLHNDDVYDLKWTKDEFLFTLKIHPEVKWVNHR
jgi:hypothetical protein